MGRLDASLSVDLTAQIKQIALGTIFFEGNVAMDNVLLKIVPV